MKYEIYTVPNGILDGTEKFVADSRSIKSVKAFLSSFQKTTDVEIWIILVNEKGKRSFPIILKTLTQKPL